MDIYGILSIEKNRAFRKLGRFEINSFESKLRNKQSKNDKRNRNILLNLFLEDKQELSVTNLTSIKNVFDRDEYVF